jgi:choline monooxygenase
MDSRAFDIDPRIESASTLPGSFYGDAALFELARERVFAPSWQFAGDAAEVDEPGSVRPLTLLPGVLDEPLILSRDEQGELACLSNVCTHRGNLLATEACRARAIVCRYHGRRFDLGGRMLSMPLFEGARDFPTRRDDLRRAELARLGPLLFVSIAPGHDFATLVAGLRERVGWLPLDEFRHAEGLARDYEFEAHWALYCDNYLEGFHIPFLHGALNARIDFESYRTELSERSSVQIAEARDGEPCFEPPSTSPDHGRRVAAYYFWLWPNLMLNFYPWGLSLNHVLPLGPTRTRVAFRVWIWREELRERGAGAGLHQVELEDEEVVTQVQRGVRSRLYDRGRFSPAQERGVHHFHRLLAAALR